MRLASKNICSDTSAQYHCKTYIVYLLRLYIVYSKKLAAKEVYHCKINEEYNSMLCSVNLCSMSKSHPHTSKCGLDLYLCKDKQIII